MKMFLKNYSSIYYAHYQSNGHHAKKMMIAFDLNSLMILQEFWKCNITFDEFGALQLAK